MLVLIRFLCMHKILKLLILKVLELNMFLKKFKNVFDIKTYKQIHLEYKETIQ